MNIEPPIIPYNFSDLEPALSRDTLVFHFLRHQRVCFDRMHAMVRGTQLESLPLEELIRVTERNPAQHGVYRYAAEVWNHNLYWHSMRPRGGGLAGGLEVGLGLLTALRDVLSGSGGPPGLAAKVGELLADGVVGFYVSIGLLVLFCRQ